MKLADNRISAENQTKQYVGNNINRPTQNKQTISGFSRPIINKPLIGTTAQKPTQQVFKESTIKKD